MLYNEHCARNTVLYNIYNIYKYSQTASDACCTYHWDFYHCNTKELLNLCNLETCSRRLRCCRWLRVITKHRQYIQLHKIHNKQSLITFRYFAYTMHCWLWFWRWEVTFKYDIISVLPLLFLFFELFYLKYFNIITIFMYKYICVCTFIFSNRF